MTWRTFSRYAHSVMTRREEVRLDKGVLGMPRKSSLSGGQLLGIPK